jgi:hypothetical protein
LRKNLAGRGFRHHRLSNFSSPPPWSVPASTLSSLGLALGIVARDTQSLGVFPHVRAAKGKRLDVIADPRRSGTTLLGALNTDRLLTKQKTTLTLEFVASDTLRLARAPVKPLRLRSTMNIHLRWRLRHRHQSRVLRSQLRFSCPNPSAWSGDGTAKLKTTWASASAVSTFGGAALSWS